MKKMNELNYLNVPYVSVLLGGRMYLSNIGITWIFISNNEYSYLNPKKLHTKLDTLNNRTIAKMTHIFNIFTTLYSVHYLL